MKPEFDTIARRSILLAAVPPDICNHLLTNAHIRSFDRGGTIFLQGERAAAIYIVADGWVKLYRIAPNGAEAIVGTFTNGASFGEAVAFRHDSYPVSAEAVTDCTLIRIEADVFLRVIRESPEIAISILSATFAHLHSLVAQIEQLKAQTGAQRVAEFLLELSNCTSGRCEVTLPYDKVLIAGRLGMKPESLSRAFARLKGYGVSIRQNVALIDDVAALRDYIEEDPALAWSRS
ncbi:Crp/Fnr family transcriptional regulator [Defluviimonas sp. WL0050]|uniref:Crp/Fnr family transcriptional regulator n=1 Tax=Albidovulum litorale TaxID=2984134 RepID=A0ABT2ZRA6_9RHOB|nr:Crp/Fnr family transcriptional regulator [Defluviimonas sp. WL0050]MCV2873475.1 Crp/Fnr family transcriptional regulator [Defluviimonas sp. WL0050]